MASIPAISEYRWRYLAALLVISALASLGFRSWLGFLVPVETLVRSDFVQTLVASGHVENPHRVNVGTQIAGTVVAVPVSEGQTVEAQALLISLAVTDLQANPRQTEIAFEQAQAKLRQLHEVQAPIAEQTTRHDQVTGSVVVEFCLVADGIGCFQYLAAGIVGVAAQVAFGVAHVQQITLNAVVMDGGVALMPRI